MPRPYRAHAPEDVEAILIKLDWMYYSAPTLEDPSFDEMYPGRTFSVVFWELREGLELVRRQIGDERCAAALELADRMRVLFESDPNDRTGEATEGRRTLRQLQDVLSAA